MTLHPNISFSELVEYCRLCREFGNEVKSVKVDKPTLQRIRVVGCIVGKETKLLGIKFFARRMPEKQFFDGTT